MPEADASVIIKRVACQLFIIKKEKGKESMKIAVTYDNGEVFQHFGRTENFKVYEIEDNKVISSEGAIYVCLIPGYWFLWAQGAKRCHDHTFLVLI